MHVHITWIGPARGDRRRRRRIRSVRLSRTERAAIETSYARQRPRGTTSDLCLDMPLTWSAAMGAYRFFQEPRPFPASRAERLRIDLGRIDRPASRADLAAALARSAAAGDRIRAFQKTHGDDMRNFSRAATRTRPACFGSFVT